MSYVFRDDFFYCLKFDVIFIHFEMNHKKRTKTQFRFTKENEFVMIFIIAFEVDHTSFNLQKKCWHNYFFENFWFKTMRNQTLYRTRRFDNFLSKINLCEYFVSHTWNIKQISRNIDKTLSEIFVNLSRNLLNENEIEYLKMSEWIWFRNQLLSVNHSFLQSLKSDDFANRIFFESTFFKHLISLEFEEKIVVFW